MDRLNYFRAVVELLDLTLSTKRKRHLVGGGLLGMALMFGTFAVTVMTAQTEKKEARENERDPNEIIDIFSGLPDRGGDRFYDPEESF